MPTTRPQWPHTVDDIIGALDGVWGIVGAISVTGNLLRLERSLIQPATYSLTEYEGEDERKVIRKESYGTDEKHYAVGEFAKLLGFGDN